MSESSNESKRQSQIESLCDSLMQKYTPDQLSDMLSSQRVNQDLYDAVKGNFTQEQLDTYQEMGRTFYEPSNFETEMPSDRTVAVAYTTEMIKSGMHPSFLQEEEKQLMEWAYGKNWYTRYGYTEQDLTQQLE